MNKVIFLFFCLLFITSSIAQRVGVENTVFLLPGVFPLNQLSSYGYSSLTGNSSNPGALNPAALGFNNKFSAGVTYQYQSSLEEAWIADIGSSRIKNAVPQSAGVVLPIGNFTFALGMNQYYNGTLDFGKIQVTTIENPNGTGEYIIVEDETIVYTYSFITSVLLKSILTPEDNLGLGLRFEFNNIERYQRIWKLATDERLNAISVAAGLTYKIINDDNNITLGLSCESGYNESKNYQIKSDNDYISPFADSIGAVYIYSNYIMRAETPFMLNAGLLIDFKNQYMISGNFNYIFWKDVLSNSDNEPQISGSVIYKASEIFAGSAGFLYSSKTYSDETNSIFGVNSRMTALYFTIGVNINYNNFYADVSLADSHLGGGKWRKHTVGKFTLGYNF